MPERESRLPERDTGRDTGNTPTRLAIAVLLGSLAVVGTDAAPTEQTTSIRDQIQASFTPGGMIDSDGAPNDIVVS